MHVRTHTMHKAMSSCDSPANSISSAGLISLYFSVGREAKSDHQDSPHVSIGKQRTSKSDPPSPRASRRSPALPTHIPSGSKRFEVGKSHSSSLTSLGESAASERRGSRLQPGSKRALSQVRYSLCSKCEFTIFIDSTRPLAQPQ